MTIVNIGANNGIDQCRDFVLENPDKVQAVHLIEPAGLDECRKNYASVPQAHFHKLAIVADDSKTATIYKPRGQDLSAHASVSAAHVYQHGHPEVDSFEVEAMTLGAFLDSLDITKCDRLYIDAEGLDCQIILGLDIEKYAFDYIEFEVLHADAPMVKAERYNACVAKLRGLGYNIIQTTQYNEAAVKC